MLKISTWPAWLASLALLIAMPALAAQNALNTVSVAEGESGSQVIKIILKEALAGEPVSFSTSNPHRLVLDLPNTGNSLGRTQENLNVGVIKNYQVVQSGDRTRIVFNLNGPASHELRKERNMLLAVLRGVGKAASEPTTVVPTRFAETGKQRDHGIRDVEFRRGKNGEGRIAVTLSDPGVGIDIQQKGKAIQVDFLNTSLPSPLQRRMDVSDFATAAQMVETFEQDKNTRMLVTPKGKWDYSAHQTGNQFIMEVRSLDDAKAAKSDKPLYTGEKLTLNFQNVEVRAVLQVIADFTGLNIIASDTVAGNLTLRLKDVPWDQALDIIMRAKGLDKRASGNVIWVAPRDELIAKEKLELEARKSIAELEPLVTRSYPLNYIRADEAMAVVSGESRSLRSNQETATCSPSSEGIKAEMSTGGNTTTNTSQGGTGRTNVNRVLSDRGGASHDLTTNTLVITDTPSRHDAVEEVLKGVDVPTRQVMIEARIVIAGDTFNKDLGVKLGFRDVGNINDTDVTTSAGVNLPRAGIPGASTFGITLFNAGANALLSLEIDAMEADRRGKVVSNPRVVTTNLRPAVILQGSQIPYLSSSANTGTETEFKDALLCLLVSPQILNNDAIILNVEVTKDVPDRSVSPPAINVRRVKTQVRVNNGETAVLGGVFEQETEDSSERVPFLADLPVLGHLFKSTSKSDEKREMLIFLTPRIIDERLGSMR
ncbi:MAG: type IV pilus secretin PilQ [Thiobacillaceae bacterium]|nr:type IV pilus secretin PilQ [Thiobacillaceae bacterium]MBP9914804.1 type IV pilus secretin PilQ [Thiobacillaceae bacterium]